MGVDRGVPLVGDGFMLRFPVESDVEAVVAACQDPLVQRFTTVPSPYTEAEARSFVAVAAEGRDAGEALHLVVVEDGTDRLLGAAAVTGLGSRDRIGNVGYWLAVSARGAGVATRATRLLCRYALGELGIQRLELQAAVENGPSNRVAQRVGFTLEGCRRSSMAIVRDGLPTGERLDANVWGLLPGELR